jgi:PIN domain nuclease of toxin-antitoxin system
MRVLLDTHAFLWWVIDNPQLSIRAREVIGDGKNEVYLSAASGWEIAIKARLGRLQLNKEPEQFMAEQIAKNAFQSLPILMSHALREYKLPGHHQDPFDRLLVAQGQLERLSILTSDAFIAMYDVEVIW